MSPISNQKKSCFHTHARRYTLLALLVLAQFTGCQLWPGATESVVSEKNDQQQSDDAELDLKASSKFRPKNPKSKPYFFFDDRASQVEKNLGY